MPDVDLEKARKWARQWIEECPTSSQAYIYRALMERITDLEDTVRKREESVIYYRRRLQTVQRKLAELEGT